MGRRVGKYSEKEVQRVCVKRSGGFRKGRAGTRRGLAMKKEVCRLRSEKKEKREKEKDL